MPRGVRKQKTEAAAETPAQAQRDQEKAARRERWKAGFKIRGLMKSAANIDCQVIDEQIAIHREEITKLEGMRRVVLALQGKDTPPPSSPATAIAPSANGKPKALDPDDDEAIEEAGQAVPDAQWPEVARLPGRRLGDRQGAAGRGHRAVALVPRRREHAVGLVGVEEDRSRETEDRRKI